MADREIVVSFCITSHRYLGGLTVLMRSPLVFDEIFGSRDEERRNNLFTPLSTRGVPLPPDPSHLPYRGDAGGFANTLQIEMGTDQSSRIRVAE